MLNYLLLSTEDSNVTYTETLQIGILLHVYFATKQMESHQCTYSMVAMLNMNNWLLSTEDSNVTYTDTSWYFFICYYKPYL